MLNLLPTTTKHFNSQTKTKAVVLKKPFFKVLVAMLLLLVGHSYQFMKNFMQTFFTTKGKTIKSVFSILALFLLNTQMSFGQISWTGTSSSAWLTTTNWTGGVVPGSKTATGNTDVAVFATATQAISGINMGTQVGTHYMGALNFNIGTVRTVSNSSGTTGTLYLNGSTLNSIANTIIWNQSAATHVITNGSSAMNLGLNNGTANIIQITAAGGLSIASVITGSNTLTKQGTGTGALTLSAINSYTGNTLIAGGTLALSGSGSIATSPIITIGNDGIFNVTGLTTALTLGATQKLRSSATGTSTTATVTVSSTKGITLGGSTAELAFTAYGGGATSPLTVAGASAGALALAGTPVTVTTTTALAAGTYVLIAKSGSATGVTGVPGALTMAGSGLAANNVGALSVVSNQLVLTVLTLTNYYSKSTGNLETLSNWGTATDGTGTAPTDFTTANQVFNIRNNVTPTIGAAWTVSGTNSKIIVGDGTNGCNFTIPALYAVTGTVDVAAAATLTNTNTTNLTLGTLNATSTVVFNAAGAQTVPIATYGNLSISNTGSSTATAGGAIAVTTALTVSSGSTFDMSTFALTGAALTTSGTGTLKTQNVTSTPLPTGRTWTMDVLYNSASGQTVVAATHANLNLTGGSRTLIASGTINISGTYTPGAGTLTVTSNTINFNGADGQTIPAANYNILTSTNNTRTLANGVIKIASTFTPGTSTYTIGTSTVEFNGSTAQTIPVVPVAGGGNYYNLTYSGSNTGTLGGSMIVAGDFVHSAGTFQVSSSATSSAITMNVTGNATFSNAAIFNLLNSTINGAAATVTVTGNTTTSGTSSINLESVDNTNASGKGIF